MNVSGGGGGGGGAWERGYYNIRHSGESKRYTATSLPRLVRLHEGKSQGLISKVTSATYITIQFEDGRISLNFIGDLVSVVGQWHKWAVKKSYKSCRFATFTHCLRITTVLAHAHNYLSTTFLLFGLDST